jgi:hypothetical protein
MTSKPEWMYGPHADDPMVTVTVMRAGSGRLIDEYTVPQSKVARIERAWTADMGMGPGRYFIRTKRI